jgi:hypothetical protein
MLPSTLTLDHLLDLQLRVEGATSTHLSGRQTTSCFAILLWRNASTIRTGFDLCLFCKKSGNLSDWYPFSVAHFFLLGCV